MPIYEYFCRECGYQADIIQKFSDPIKTRCDQCGKETFEKKMSLPSFALKGGGWYSDGYGTKSESTQAGEGSTADSTKTEAGSSNAKPAAEVSKKETKSSSDKKPAADTPAPKKTSTTQPAA